MVLLFLYFFHKKSNLKKSLSILEKGKISIPKGFLYNEQEKKKETKAKKDIKT